MFSHPACATRRMFRRVHRTALFLAAAALVAAAGCSPQSGFAPTIAPIEQIAPDALVVPSDVPWVDTGIDVVAGQPLSIVGNARATITKLKRIRDDSERDAVPQGTFFD